MSNKRDHNTHRPITEHHLQKSLTSRWLTTGIPIGDEVLTLVAWEVMLPSWRIHDAHAGFGQPAIDFLAVDEAGGLAAIELKLRISGEKTTLRAACQVSYLTALIDQSKSVDRVERARDACLSGRHGRTRARIPENPPMDLSQPTRAILAAVAWSTSAGPIIDSFRSQTVASNCADLERRGLRRASRANKQCHRYATLSPEAVTAIQMIAVAMDPE